MEAPEDFAQKSEAAAAPTYRMEVRHAVVLRMRAILIVDVQLPPSTSMLTGEPVPVDVGPGSKLAGGTINTDGRLVVRGATAVGAETALARIARLVAEAQTGKSPASSGSSTASRVCSCPSSSRSRPGCSRAGSPSARAREMPSQRRSQS